MYKLILAIVIITFFSVSASAVPVVDEPSVKREPPGKEIMPHIKKGDIITLDGSRWQVVREDEDRYLICPYHADEDFYQERDWGWFYGEECRWFYKNTLISRLKEEQAGKAREQQEEEIPWEKVTTDEYLSKLTASQFRKLYTKVRETAIMEPVEKHIHAYMHMTDFMRRKALVFAHATQDFVLANPRYDMEKNIGTTSWSYPFINQIQRQKRDELFKRVSDRAGLYFFVSGTCPYCKEEAKVLSWFSADYGWNVISVASDFCTSEYPNCIVRPELFKIFNATYTPSIFLIYRRLNNKPVILPVANGLTTYDTLKSRIFYYLKQLEAPDQEQTLRVQSANFTPSLLYNKE